VAKYHVVRIKAKWQPNRLHNIDYRESREAQELLEYLESFDRSEVVSVTTIEDADEVLIVTRSPNE
jgi:hypothetical protein